MQFNRDNNESQVLPIPGFLHLLNRMLASGSNPLAGRHKEAAGKRNGNIRANELGKSWLYDCSLQWVCQETIAFLHLFVFAGDGIFLGLLDQKREIDHNRLHIASPVCN